MQQIAIMTLEFVLPEQFVSQEGAEPGYVPLGGWIRREHLQDVPGGDVGVGPEVPMQLVHEALAEAHHFIIGFALGIEISTAFGSAHGERGEAVL